MLYVSLIVELLRARPSLLVWAAALAQAALWTLVPTLFYASPPGDVPLVLAVGHEFQLGTYLGPPLAFWLAEIAYTFAGRSLVGVYALSQICVVITYWAVWALGRSIVGAQHAALGVLLMIGISTFSVPTPDFGPVVLTMPVWALILLHYWRAVGEGRPRCWLALAFEIGILLLTTYAGLLLIALLVIFTLADSRARAQLRTTDPWMAVIVAVVVMLPHLLWLASAGEGVVPMLVRLRTPEAAIDNLTAWLRQVTMLLAAHAGVFVLVLLVFGWPAARQVPAPVIVRRPVDPFARQFVYVFAIAPALVATIAGVLVGWPGPVGGIAPLVILSGLAIVLAAGDAIAFRHQHVVIYGWLGLLMGPPVLAILAILALPWIALDLSINRPVAAVAQFFSDSYQRRIGAPLPIVAGDPRTASLIALGAPARPRLYLDATPARSPWVTLDEVKSKGAVIVWPTEDTAGTPPPEIRERFPDIVPEVPRAFEHPLRGQLPLLRIGWAVIRPQAQTVAAPPPEAPQ